MGEGLGWGWSRRPPASWSMPCSRLSNPTWTALRSPPSPALPPSRGKGEELCH